MKLIIQCLSVMILLTACELYSIREGNVNILKGPTLKSYIPQILKIGWTMEECTFPAHTGEEKLCFTRLADYEWPALKAYGAEISKRDNEFQIRIEVFTKVGRRPTIDKFYDELLVLFRVSNELN